MKIKKNASRLIAVLLSVILLFGCIPFATVAEETTEFVSENLLTTKIDLENSKGILFTHSSRTVTDSTNGGISANNVVAALVDGDTAVGGDIWALSTTDSRWYGVQYALTESAYASHITLYAGFANTTNEDGTINYLNDAYDVYAADNLDDLYMAENMVGKDVICTGEVVKLTVERTVKYVALVYNASVANQTNARPKEIQLWSGDESAAVTKVNHLRDTLNDNAVLLEAKPVKIDSSTGAVSDYASNNDKLTAVITADNTNHTDMYTESGSNLGLQFTLLASANISNVVIDAGIWGYNEKYDIYLSDDIDTLYADTSKVAEGVECTNSTGVNVAINKKAKYIAIVATEHNGVRIRRIKVIGEKLADDTFVTENLFRTKLATTEGVNMYASTGATEASEKFEEKDIFNISVNGDTVTSVDIGTGLDWDPVRYVGGVYGLSEAVYSSHIMIYSGYTTSVDTLRVYASDSSDDLYNDSNMVADNVKCDGSGTKIELNKTVKYVAFFLTGYELYLCRVREFELWSGDPADAPEVFVSENVLTSNVSAAQPIVQWPTSGQVDYSSVITDDVIAKFTDGDSDTHSDLDNTMSWDPARYIGVEYSLDNKYFIGAIKLYASIGDSYPETYSIYASDTLDNLYSATNCVAKSVETTGLAIVAEINAEVQYIAFICEACVGNVRVKEIEAWTADPDAVPPAEDTHKKVLTIGNSFAENASVYASEIAYANGEELTFGYLKYPSCSLEKHLEAAKNDLAVFKFQITDPTGNKTVVKSGKDTSFTPTDETTNANGATVKEALEYTDWDIIVFQQESSSARNADSYSYLGALIEYVSGYCPDAEFMFHEVWRWGEWDADQFDLIKKNSEAAACKYNLTVIPSGLAFEYARESLESVTAVNEDDGHWQHANTYGMYVAGCVYVATVFDIEISADTFASHPYVNDNGNVALLTAAANKAVDYYNSYGDLNDDNAVNTDDLVLLRKSLLGMEDVDLTLADANYDGNNNILDLIRVKRYLADDTVVLGCSK